MPIFACTMFLEIDRQNTGWTETFYRNFNDSSAAKLAFITVANARYATLGSGARILKIRVSDVAISGDSSEDRNFVLPPPPTLSVGFASVGYQMRYESTDLHRSLRLLRGLPAVAFANNNPAIIADAGVAQAVDLFHTALLNAYSFRVKKKPPAVPQFNIQKAEYDPATKTATITTTANHNITVNSTVNVTGMRQFVRELSGIKFVTAVTANTLQYVLPPTILSIVIDTPYNGKGRVSIVDFDYPIITRIVYQRWTDRQSGRPFELQVGRR